MRDIPHAMHAAHGGLAGISVSVAGATCLGTLWPSFPKVLAGALSMTTVRNHWGASHQLCGGRDNDESRCPRIGLPGRGTQDARGPVAGLGYLCVPLLKTAQQTFVYQNIRFPIST